MVSPLIIKLRIISHDEMITPIKDLLVNAGVKVHQIIMTRFGHIMQITIFPCGAFVALNVRFNLVKNFILTVSFIVVDTK